jgi:hypothetical protein
MGDFSVRMSMVSAITEVAMITRAFLFSQMPCELRFKRDAIVSVERLHFTSFSLKSFIQRLSKG